MESDWPVSTPNPLKVIEVAVRRISPDDRGAAPLVLAEGITLPETLRAFTSVSA